MNVQETNEIRELTADELAEVAGGNPIAVAIAGWLIGEAAGKLADEIGLFDPVVRFENGKVVWLR